MARRGSATWMGQHYGPPGRRNIQTIEIANGVKVHVRDVAVPAFKALGAIMLAWGYHVRQGETWGLAVRKIRGSSQWSNHAWGLAVDINASTNPIGARLVTDMPAGMVAQIKQIKTLKSGQPVFRWGGDYKVRKDAMHFEIMATPGELAEGLSVPTVNRVNVVPPEGGGRLRARMLKRGDKGNDVKQMQRLVNGVLARSARLGAEEVPGVALDGVFGPATEAALAHAIPRAFHYAGFDAGEDWSPDEVSMAVVSAMMVAVGKMGVMLERA